MLTITRKLEFDAGHRIPDHNSQCRNLHGHRYTLLITLVGAVIERPVVAALRRRRYTQVQAQLKRALRIENVRAAFAFKPEAQMAGKKVLLVDDVYTTGATMQECARVLLGAGAAQVAGFTLARG